MNDALLVFDRIEKSYGENTVLRGVSFDVRAGEVHALLGENGAGKSTLMRVLLGLEVPNAGTTTLAGVPYRPKSARAARDAGVVMVPQERTLCAHLDVAENIVLGIEPARGGVVRRAEARAIAERVLAQLGTAIDVGARAGALSVAEQQLVEIARALAQAGANAKVLVLDEPTSSLGQADAARLFERVASLRASGLAIVLVTHFLSDVRTQADRYTVLRDGKVQDQGDARSTSPERIVHAMLGRELEAALAKPAEDEASSAEGARDVLLEARDVAGKVRPRRATLTVRRGEILGIAGLVGSGRTELLRVLAGLDAPAAGSVVRHAPRGVGLLSEDRGGEGLMLQRSVADNVTLSPRGGFFVDPRRTKSEGAKWIGELQIRARGPEQTAGELSGGNQQKVQLARLLREDFDVLLVDEPTRGIDVASKAQVLALLRELAARGKGVVLVSSQLDELVAACDRIAVLAHGELGAPKPAKEWTEERLLLEAAS